MGREPERLREAETSPRRESLRRVPRAMSLAASVPLKWRLAESVMLTSALPASVLTTAAVVMTPDVVQEALPRRRT